MTTKHKFLGDLKLMTVIPILLCTIFPMTQWFQFENVVLLQCILFALNVAVVVVVVNKLEILLELKKTSPDRLSH